MAEKKASAKKRYRRSPSTKKTTKRTVRSKKTVTSKSNVVGITEFPSKEQAGRFKRKVSSTKKNKRAYNRNSNVAAVNIPKKEQDRVLQMRKNKSSEKRKKLEQKFENSSKRQRKAAFLRMQTEGTLWKKAKTGRRTLKNKTEKPPRKIKQGGITW